MTCAEPPKLARWILEHLVPSAHDDALGGDLLEEFHSGRSAGWYWRQVLSALAIGWLCAVRVRVSAILFAALWSLLSPAWKVFCDHMQDSPAFSSMWQRLGGIWILPAAVVWIVLHSYFLWAGLLVYLLFEGRIGRSLRNRNVRGAFFIAPAIFLPIAGVTFVAMNLYAYPGLVDDKLAHTPLGQILDLRMTANVLRIPYFLALLAGLWVAKRPLSRASGPLSAEAMALDAPAQLETPAQSGALAIAARFEPSAIGRLFAFMVAAGLVNAMIAAFLLCRLPDAQAPSLASLLMRAIVYVTVGALAGIGGTWLYWKSPSSPFREEAPLPFSLFAAASAAGWVWAPSMALLSEQFSPAVAFVAMTGALAIAPGLRNATSFVVVTAGRRALTSSDSNLGLFSEALTRPPISPYGYLIAATLYASGWALAAHANLLAAATLAGGAFLFSWHRTVAPAPPLDADREMQRAIRRLAAVALPAVLVTLWALLNGVAQREANAALGSGNSPVASSVRPHPPSHDLAVALDGYESIVLWPEPPKKDILAPVQPPTISAILAKPLVIRFNGAYWYFQPPADHPGPHAHVTHGDPLAADIHSTSPISLTMEAHQMLASSLQLHSCSAVQVEIQNRDNRPGPLSLAMVLTDTAARGKPSLPLAAQPILSTQPGRFNVKSSSVAETLRFAIPAHAPLKKFDEITLIVIADRAHFDMGSRIAIRQFELEPR